jgi:predicted MFS family arabinose efflux permease
MPADGIARALRVAATPPFGLYLGGHVAASSAEWMMRTSVGWLIWDRTGSTAWLGAFGFALLAPSVLGTIWGGALADRRDRRQMIALSRIVAAAFCLATLGLVLMDQPKPALILALAAVAGFAQGLAQASAKTIVSDLVPVAILPNAVALNATAHNVATLAAPALAAVLIAQGGVGLALAVAAFLYALSVAVVSAMPRMTRPRAEQPPILRDIALGMTHVARSPVLAPLMGLHAAAALLVRPVLDMAPALAALALGRGPDGVALITGGVGAGAIAGGLWLAGGRQPQRLPRIVLAAVAAAALTAMILPHTAGALAAFAVSAIFGVAIVLRAAGLQSLLQLRADPVFRGRVLGLYGLILHLSGAIGGLALGLLADRIGLGPALVLTAAGVLAVTLALARLVLATAPTEPST